MAPRQTSAILLAWGLMVSNVRAVIPDDLPRYRQGLHDFRAGRYTAARDAFQEISPRKYG